MRSLRRYVIGDCDQQIYDMVKYVRNLCGAFLCEVTPSGDFIKCIIRANKIAAKMICAFGSFEQLLSANAAISGEYLRFAAQITYGYNIERLIDCLKKDSEYTPSHRLIPRQYF